nr:MAG TPA: hypothetical protein [Caudoviricetes sp.]
MQERYVDFLIKSGDKKVNFRRGRGGPNPCNHAALGPMPPQTCIFAKLKRG